MVTNQQVTYIQPGRPAFTGPQGGMVIIQPTGGVTTTTPAYPAVAQPQVYVQQQVHVSSILKKRLWSQIRMNALVMKFYCLSCGIVTFKFAVLKLIKLKLSKMYIEWERWSVGWVEKKKDFFGLVTSVGQRKNSVCFVLFFFNLILFCNCVFLWFVC